MRRAPGECARRMAPHTRVSGGCMRTPRYALPSSWLARPHRRSLRWRGQISAWLFLLPALLVFAFFSWYPIVTTIGYSFQNLTMTGASSWAGLSNYERMIHDPLFGKAWQNVL